MNDFKNKVAVITGAGSGIGAELAKALASKGATVALCDLNGAALQQTVDSLGNSAKSFQRILDVSNQSQFSSFAEEVIKEYGQVDLMFNNAGIALGKYSAVNIPEQEFRNVMEVNFWGMVRGSQPFLPHLIKQSEAVLVNISSLFGLVGIANQSPYCASKFAIRGYTESLIMELGKLAFEKNLRLPPEEAAKIILKGIQKKRSRIIVGSDARFADWLVRLMPSRSIRMLGKKMMQGRR